MLNYHAWQRHESFSQKTRQTADYFSRGNNSKYFIAHVPKILLKYERSELQVFQLIWILY